MIIPPYPVHTYSHKTMIQDTGMQNPRAATRCYSWTCKAGKSPPASEGVVLQPQLKFGALQQQPLQESSLLHGITESSKQLIYQGGISRMLCIAAAILRHCNEVFMLGCIYFNAGICKNSLWLDNAAPSIVSDSHLTCAVWTEQGLQV